MTEDQTFEIRSYDREALIEVLEVASRVLGLRSCKDLRDAPFPYVN